ncbi:MAG: DUF3857 domain-containing protein [Salibacteraceae bacterium]
MSLYLKRLIKSFTLISLVFTAFSGFAQFQLMDYDWEKTLIVPTIPDSLKEEVQIYFKKYQKVEFGFKDEQFSQIEVTHELFWVNSDEAIDRNNKVYVPMGKGTEVLLTRARVINPDGKITELNEDDVKELTDENENTAYYYALKGIELGSFVEYFYVIQTAPRYNGTRKVAQEMAPILDYQFDLISPTHLIFATKSYHGFGELQEDTSNTDYNHLTKHINYIPKFEKEDQAYNIPNRMAVIYKLDKNTANNTSNLVSYKSVGNNLITGFSVGSKTDLKALKSMLKEANIDETKSEKDILRDLEYYYKTNFSIFQANADELGDLAWILKNKASNSPGFMKFMALCSEKYGIDYRFVITANRQAYAFDPKFEAYTFLRKYLMYFPKLDLYMDMESKFGRLGIVNQNFQDNYGVFFKKVTVGEVVSSVSKIKWIEGTDAETSHSDMDMTVKVPDDFSTLNFTLTTSATGHNVAEIQPYFGLMTPENEKKIKEQLIKWVDEDMDLHEVKAENTGYQVYGEKPLLMTGDFSIDKYIVSVRDKYLIKLGLFIGPQAEMYQDAKARKFPVDMGFRKNYHRVIKFEIPEGYKATNLESINMEVLAKEEDGTVYADFISSYALNGNILTVTCDERYHKIHYPVEQYEDYRNVINAAADFNKIVIYLEEK